MTKPTRKQIIFIIIGVLIIAAIVYGFLPKAQPVNTAIVEQAPLQVTIKEEGQTHVKHRYKITSPVTAFAHRITLDPGNEVEKGQQLVVLESPDLSPRHKAQTIAQVEAAEAALKRAREKADHAIEERERIERLEQKGAATQQQMEQAQAAAATAIAARNAARAKLKVSKAQAGLSDAVKKLPNKYILQAPISGRVLTVHHRSSGVVTAGQPLLTIGNVDQLELRIDVLSKDAVRISKGTRIIITQWGGTDSLVAKVTRIQPKGHTKISALGVEEQRVEVTAEFVSPRKKWDELGSGYHVLAEFIVWQSDSVLQVPTSALFRTPQDHWAVFVVESGTAHHRKVEVGHQTGLSAQILDGLSENDLVIVHPASDIEDGVEVEMQ